MDLPKKIWGLWCDFKNKKDGDVNKEYIDFFINRIKSLHDNTWEVTIITEWSKLLDITKEDTMLTQLIYNEYVEAAHKSDAIRYYILKKFGGFWIDVSTFLVQSLDYLHQKFTNDKITFSCYYIPMQDTATLLFKPTSELYDVLPYSKLEKVRMEQYLKLNDSYSKFNFITENYFIAATPNHPIIINTYNILMKFWQDSLPTITKENLCYTLNKYMNSLVKTIFDTKLINMALINLFENNNTSSNNIESKLLENTWNCSYLFNYLQLYIAMCSYINESKNYQIIKSQETTQMKALPYYQDLCDTDKCSDIYIKMNQGSIYLFSGIYVRVAKWANTSEERTTWKNTFILDQLQQITDDASAKRFLENCKNVGIYQIKFSSWSRKNNLGLELLRKWFGSNIKTQVAGHLDYKKKYYKFKTKFTAVLNKLKN